jgi:hypothetical protein
MARPPSRAMAPVRKSTLTPLLFARLQLALRLSSKTLSCRVCTCIAVLVAGVAVAVACKTGLASVLRLSFAPKAGCTVGIGSNCWPDALAGSEERQPATITSGNATQTSSHFVTERRHHQPCRVRRRAKPVSIRE